MKQWWKRIVVFLAVVCVFLGTSQNVMAEGTLISSEIVEKYIGGTGKYYDVGGSIGNGAFEIKSTSDSLKAGDTVEVQIIYNADNTGHNLCEMIIYLYYDKDLLQYSDVITNDAYGKSSFHVDSSEERDKGAFLYLSSSVSTPFNQNGCIATAQFTVKKDTSAVTIYGGHIDASATDAQVYFYLDDKAEGGGGKMMSVTVKDTSVPDPEPAAGEFALSDGSVEGRGEILIPIEIKANKGFAALGLTINYDPAFLSYKALEVDSSIEEKFTLKDINPTDGQIKAAFLAGQNITDVGSFLNLTLETKESAATATVSNVSVTVTQVADYDEKLLNGTGAVYTVTLAEDTPSPSGQKLGDVNNDGNIDREDAFCILQYYNAAKQLTDNEKTAADVDKNGEVDLIDALKIMKYYNGEISEF